jgi:hypothetical protein
MVSDGRRDSRYKRAGVCKDECKIAFDMTSKAPSYYRCPCCDSTFVHRRGRRCPQCDIALHLEGEYMVEPCYLYRYEEKKWVWFEGNEMHPWEDGWKRRPKKYKSAYCSWLEQYPNRPTDCRNKLARVYEWPRPVVI